MEMRLGSSEDVSKRAARAPYVFLPLEHIHSTEL